ncbi:MAG: zf-HC2 domain-containing protein [Pseudomonadota bacterium]|uniref:zf-HC2 domain-containing protein n=1 Tax=Alcanivorax sp. NBRC 102024 TaxID=1113895 RepID=UPI000789DD5D|nr:zf-HC2 domain-containing protein [Alcanivorax sp. NBRC 102024]MEE2604259.1 zf-HC2 domain-containing protein [Pseudomonadota bacterium]
MLKCKHVTEKADALVDGSTLSWRERLALRLHLLMCGHCRRYVRQMGALLGFLPRQEAPLEDAHTKAILKKLDSLQDS